MNTITLDKTRVFQCTHCGEYINTSMSVCSFCGGSVSEEAAEKAADVQTAIGNACSEANYLKIAARTLPLAYIGSFIPFLGSAIGWAFLILLFVNPVLFLRWWIKYPAIQTTDRDYQRAKTSTWVSLAIWGSVSVVWVVVSVLFSLALNQYE